jgi:predicted ArsR family transcriptional regulator
MTTSTLTQTQRVLNALQAGEALTAKQIAARFKVASPRKVVSNIRYEGYAVYLNKHTDTKGRITHKYRIGKPTRKLIAAGYRALAMGV